VRVLLAYLVACLALGPAFAAPAPDPGAALLKAARGGADPLALAALASGGVAAAPVPPLELPDWLIAHGVAPTDAVTAVRALDAQPAPARVALVRVVGAFAAFEAAARVDPLQVAPQRLALLDAALALRSVTPHLVPLKLQAPPALALDLAGTADVYVADFALLLDVGGDDLYLNNAGGNGPGGGCTIGFQRPASAAVDLAGNDRYTSGRRCGVNGGGWIGAGFLLDAAGHDLYGAAGIGANGGAFVGSGFLVDLAGHDAYAGDAVGVNGGGTTGGSGTLLDLGGNDHYTGGAVGVNGGGSTEGRGLLLDAGGDDTYVATQIGVNGGGWLGGQGALVDASGDDYYTAGVLATNGSGGGLEYGAPGAGLLLDGGGRDNYVDETGGTGQDVSVVPKGIAGAQLDLPG
jgi:hypothetical protein